MARSNDQAAAALPTDAGRPKPPATGIRRYLPFLEWIPNYDRKNLGGDVSAGLTTAVMLIPQAMAYAMLAGLPPIVGLYASLVPLAIYSLLGTSRELAVGPVAMVSLLVAQGVAPLAETGTEAFVMYAVLLAGMVGLMQLLMGVFRLGFLVNFLSHPVISGFTSAAALIIGFSQLKHLLGIDLERSKNIFVILQNAVGAMSEWHVATIVIAVASIALLMGLKKWKPVFPRALAVVVLGSLAVFALGLEEAGVRIVRDVPAGLPSPSLPTMDLEAIQSLLPIAVTISLVSFMESISVAKAFARKNRYDVDPSQELVALGAANLGGTLFGAYPVTGGFSRTAVNAQAGAKSGLAGLITAAVIGLTLLFLTPLFYFLPKAVLAAIIMTAVFGLVDIAEMKHLWKVKKSDLALLVLTFVATLGLGIEEGILVGVGASLVTFVVRTTRPHVAVLGRLPGTEEYRNVERFPEAETTPGVLAVRVDAQFYFGNVTFLKDMLKSEELAMDAPLRAVVLDASGMNQLDSSAEAALEELHEAYEERGIRMVLAGIKGPVRDVLKRSGLWERLGEEGRALRVHDAMESVADGLAEDVDEAPPSEPARRERSDQETKRTRTSPRPALAT
ncbi:MAG TPA: solute carrier family 26 protein [Polyangiaceae bacterium LLY-WYZ-15_(1-7)]|nr:sodium-independent anion transporter [Myxococcales bacterium]MAT24579.1 sodium-independent anion transporter [Sandaracinus sp.]HJK94770.1 solute carrier family 26 protein [Polyangiaceae bacterium LLY-WYZ-15_(1-7)]MBJ75372.1 sodium-independent anion transporter [Sandaracinus sp.]HJL04487.1 solute carrier family 26 protein [Polyangiaceae bacterium LLY-WYZ-15_(1-7)]